eukprot:Gb_24061 [translate_table: standard]
MPICQTRKLPCRASPENCWCLETIETSFGCDDAKLEASKIARGPARVWSYLAAAAKFFHIQIGAVKLKMGRKRQSSEPAMVKGRPDMEEGELQSEAEEANADLSLRILAKATDRYAKRKRTAPSAIEILSSEEEEDVQILGNEKSMGREIGTLDGGELYVDLCEDEENGPETKGFEVGRDGDAVKDDVAAEKDRAVSPSTPGFVDATLGIGGGNKKKKKKKRKTVDQNQELPLTTPEVTQTQTKLADNMVMRKLLRGPRYFDPPEEQGQLCYNCGESGHFSANCAMERRKKPCYVCGNIGHEAKDCQQGIECFVCKRVGHYAKNCPEKRSKGDRSNSTSQICFRCGDVGHDLLSCRNDYKVDDLKANLLHEIQCYICKRFGHLCCVDVIDSCARELSCYNCGEKGHTGLGCAKTRGKGNEGPAKTCYKCGEEGHFARGCTRNDKFDRWMADPNNPDNGQSQEDSGFFGFRSVPRNFGKLRRWTDMQAEGRNSATPTPREFRSRNGWRMDHVEGWDNRTPHRMDCWDSPAETLGFRSWELASGSTEQHSNGQTSKKPKFSPYTPNGLHNSYGHHNLYSGSKSSRRKDGWRKSR